MTIRRRTFARVSVLLIAASSLVTAATHGASAAPADPTKVPITATGAVPMMKAGQASKNFATQMKCASSGNTQSQAKKVGCVELSTVSPPKGHVPRLKSAASPMDLVPVPDWCLSHAYQGIYAIRTEACAISTTKLVTRQLQPDGTFLVTGEIYFDVYNYTYGSTFVGNWTHEVQVSAYDGWGDAQETVLSATARAVYSDYYHAPASCSVDDYSFESWSLLPYDSIRWGQSTFTTTATAAGAIGYCQTIWDLLFTTPGYTDAGGPLSMDEMRCDTATLGRSDTGCVVPWYPSELVYSQSATPELASHVSQAQASGLPGAGFSNPLYRTNRDDVQKTNRSRACDDAPSIAAKSCDEYPFATTYNGLWAGGTRRTFDGCNFDLPQQTGPTGVSVCMIAVSDQSSQGGTNNAFYRSQRVLDDDPFVVHIGP